MKNFFKTLLLIFSIFIIGCETGVNSSDEKLKMLELYLLMERNNPAPTNYTIIYVSDYGTPPGSKKVESGYKLTGDDLPNLTAEGQTFVGWNKSVGDAITDDTVITAIWKQGCKLTYKSDYGTVPPIKSVEAGYKLTEADLPKLSAEGQTFLGWDKSSGYIVTGDTVITAIWQKPCRLSYRTTYGNPPTEKTVEAGYKLTNDDLPSLTAEGETFLGWDKTSGYIVTDDTVLTAIWLKTCNITYISNYGTPPAKKTVNAGYKLKKTDLPSLKADGEIFVGWNVTTDYIVTDDLIITAIWKKACKISYSSKFGTLPAEKTVEAGYELVKEDLPKLEAKDEMFLGWDKWVNYVVTGDTLIKAYWKGPCEISYQSEYGTPPAQKTVQAGYKLTAADLPKLEAEGETFKGWDMMIGDVVNTSVVITAKWERLCTITYGTEFGVAPQPKTVAKDYVLKESDLPPIDSEGHIFKGWTKKAGDKITDDTFIQAKWVTGMKLTYESDYVDPPKYKYVEEDYKLQAEDLPPLSYEGYKFDGWDHEVGYRITANTTIKALWTKLLKVSYTSDHGTAPQPIYVDNGYQLAEKDLPDLTPKSSEKNWYFGCWEKNVGDKITEDTEIIAEWYDTWVGTEAPGSRKLKTGDFVFNDGSFMPLKYDDIKKYMEKFVVAFIFYDGSADSKSVVDLGDKILGIGVDHSEVNVPWCTTDANAYNVKFNDLLCTPQGNVDQWGIEDIDLVYTFAQNNYDGSKAFDIIKDTLNKAKKDDTDNAEKYPMFYFAKNYSKETARCKLPDDMKDGWYVPSVAEVYAFSRQCTDFTDYGTKISRFLKTPYTLIVETSTPTEDDDKKIWLYTTFVGKGNTSYRINGYAKEIPKDYTEDYIIYPIREFKSK